VCVTSFLKDGVCAVGPFSALVASLRGWGQLQPSCLRAPCNILLFILIQLENGLQGVCADKMAKPAASALA
jgi:hypothetical protein